MINNKRLRKDELQNLVERITLEVIQDMKPSYPQKKILFVFCDSSTHESYLDQMILFKKHSFQYDVITLDSETSGWLGNAYIQSTGACQVIAFDSLAPAPIELPIAYEAIIVPEIDLDEATRITMGLKGTVQSELVFSSLLLGKPVISCVDFSGIKRPDRRTLQTIELPQPYRQLLKKRIIELKEMGVYFAKQSSLFSTFREIAASPENQTEEQMKEHFYEGRLLTLKWLSSNRLTNQALFVKKTTIITPSARDYMKEKNINLIVYNNGSFESKGEENK
ncbi:hypothetical protein [Fredinandcohnia quinoae]|uniref:Uncharacterized protein n=1 Tax=Fredinandcohnia quinoae TaxID=2918902 RepID=A0AAW5DYB2_9BACI|nr:hypothetical protein [Fredinandcohnia sp. SECRCQ15]MCH1624020.1 hypothetical protein [Fredinandcohnia sp. SECRCQ15]